jgi:hypothetical protein
MLAEVRAWLSDGDPDEVSPPPETDAPSPPDPADAGMESLVREPPRASAAARPESRPRRVEDAVVPAPADTPSRSSAWNSLGPWLLLGLGFFALGGWLLAWGFGQFTETSDWLVGEGVVAEVDRTDDSVSVTIVYEAGGRTYAFSSTADERAARGDVMEILIHPADPSQATTQRDRITAFVLRLVFGGLAVVTGFVPIWWGRRLRRVDRY